MCSRGLSRRFSLSGPGMYRAGVSCEFPGVSRVTLSPFCLWGGAHCGVECPVCSRVRDVRPVPCFPSSHSRLYRGVLDAPPFTNVILV